jgi:hypothetical protein
MMCGHPSSINPSLCLSPIILFYHQPSKNSAADGFSQRQRKVHIYHTVTPQQAVKVTSLSSKHKNKISAQ